MRPCINQIVFSEISSGLTDQILSAAEKNTDFFYGNSFLTSGSLKDVLLFRVCFSQPINMKQSLKFSKKSPSILFLLNIHASRFFIASIHKIDNTEEWIVLIFIIFSAQLPKQIISINWQ